MAKSLTHHIDQIKWLCALHWDRYAEDHPITMDELRYAVQSYRAMEAACEGGLLATSSYQSPAETWLWEAQREIVSIEWIEKESGEYSQEELKEYMEYAQKLKDIMSELEKEE